MAIVKLLVSRPDCDVFAINCDGELARDVCDGEECLQLIEERMRADLALPGEDPEDGIPETVLQEMRSKELSRIESDFRDFLRENPVLTSEAIKGWIERTRDPISGATVLHVCAAKGYTECLQNILETIQNSCGDICGELVDQSVDSDGFTCLHASAFWQQMSSFETLLRFGADFDLKTRDSRLVTDLCKENPKIMEIIFEAKQEKEMNKNLKLSETSETQRRLNARRQRETRRPTQGVTKEDIQMALKTVQSDNPSPNDTNICKKSL